MGSTVGVAAAIMQSRSVNLDQYTERGMALPLRKASKTRGVTGCRMSEGVVVGVNLGSRLAHELSRQAIGSRTETISSGDSLLAPSVPLPTKGARQVI